jgi:hypothetical protein
MRDPVDQRQRQRNIAPSPTAANVPLLLLLPPLRTRDLVNKSRFGQGFGQGIGQQQTNYLVDLAFC